MITRLKSALLLSVACFAILSLFGWTRHQPGDSTEQPPAADDETALFVG